MADVVGDDPRPVWAWLLSHDNPGPKPDALAPNWNFCKYVLSRSGELVAAFGTRAYAGRDPEADEWLNSPIIAAIEAELGK